MTDKRRQRKHPAHGILMIDGQPTIIFDTVCIKDQQPWLACEAVHQTLREVWQGATAWLMGRYEEKYEYVRSNPVRLGLVEKPEDWPFHGEIHELRWD